MAARWLSSMTTGVAELDRQHQQLIDQLSRLSDAMTEGRGLTQLPQTLEFLANYVQTHFADEEAAMAKYRCPAAEDNHLAHQQFTSRLADLRAVVAAHGAMPEVLAQTFRELTDWLVDHIWGIDTKLKDAVA
jgi:hemerythrin